MAMRQVSLSHTHMQTRTRTHTHTDIISANSDETVSSDVQHTRAHTHTHTRTHTSTPTRTHTCTHTRTHYRHVFSSTNLDETNVLASIYIWAIWAIYIAHVLASIYIWAESYHIRMYKSFHLWINESCVTWFVFAALVATDQVFFKWVMSRTNKYVMPRTNEWVTSHTIDVVFAALMATNQVPPQETVIYVKKTSNVTYEWVSHVTHHRRGNCSANGHGPSVFQMGTVHRCLRHCGSTGDRWGMSHMDESCHIWMSHVTYEWVMSHMNE